jgi:hypothetical protein
MLMFLFNLGFVFGPAGRAKDFHFLIGTNVFLFKGLGAQKRHIATGTLGAFSTDQVTLLGHLVPPL